MSNNSQNSFQRDLGRRFPRAGFWFGMQPSHPFIHGGEDGPQLGPTRPLGSRPATPGRAPSEFNPPPSQPQPSPASSSQQGIPHQPHPPPATQPPLTQEWAAGQDRMFNSFAQPSSYPPSFASPYPMGPYFPFTNNLPPPVQRMASPPGHQPMGLHGSNGMPVPYVFPSPTAPFVSPSTSLPFPFSGPWYEQWSSSLLNAVSASRRSRQNADHVTRPSSIKVSIPRNTGVPGSDEDRLIISFPTDLPFDDFLDRVCANMDIHPSTATLGYKFHTDRVRDPPHRLSNQEELDDAIETGVGLMSRARTRTIVLEIHNLASHSAQTASRKRKGAPTNCGVDENGHPSSTIGYSAQLRMVREHFCCARHRGQYCRINPHNGDHHPMDLYEQTFYAKKIADGEASLQHPPSSLQFDRASKRTRRSHSRTRTSSSSTPAIHLHLPQILTDQIGQRLVNTSVMSSTSTSRSNPSPPPVISPAPVIAETSRSSRSQPPSNSNDLLPSAVSAVASHGSSTPPLSSSISELFAVLNIHYPDFNFTRFEQPLRDHGYDQVDSLETMSHDFLVDVIGMPLDAVEIFEEEVQAMLGRARKGKGRLSGERATWLDVVEEDQCDDDDDDLESVEV